MMFPSLSHSLKKEKEKEKEKERKRKGSRITVTHSLHHHDIIKLHCKMGAGERGSF